MNRIEAVTQARNPHTMIQSLIHKVRTLRAQRPFGGLPAFLAGGAHAEGFLDIHRCTSPMTGIVSEPAGNWVLGNCCRCAAGLAAPMAFRQVGLIATLWQNTSDWLRQTRTGQTG